MPTLPACVGSVRNQTHQTFQHLIQDGGSNDGTVDWLNTQTGLDWSSEHDSGMYDAINRAWERSSGDIISWLNADEQYLPHTLQMVKNTFDNYPCVDAVYGNCILVDARGRTLSSRREIRLRKWYIANGILYPQSCTAFFRKSLIKKIGGFNPSYKIAGDLEWILRLLSAGIKTIHIPYHLGIFAIDSYNLSLNPRAYKEIQSIRETYGGYSSAIARSLPRFLRYLEKAFTGAYFPKRVTYQYTKNEFGAFEIKSDIAWPFWKWNDKS